MAHIGLVACVGKKRPHAAPAQELYDSALFDKSRQFVSRRCDRWFILSAKHGLLEPTAVVEPYEETLNGKTSEERRAWARRVWTALRRRLRPGDRVTILAGKNYREFLCPFLAEYGCRVEVPLRGLRIGQQLQWFSRQSSPRRWQDVQRLYRSLRVLESAVGGKRLMADCHGRLPWPQSGVYFLFEPGEVRSDARELRIVRVGTHRVSRGAKSTLWERLRAHRGTARGGGNHRGSVFRLHVGAAIAAKEPAVGVASWGCGKTPTAAARRAEKELERRVSAHIATMSLLWLAVEDEAGPMSDRAYLERNLIGLLAGGKGPADPPSAGWLGRFSPQRRIRTSGLWNLDHLDHAYRPEFLDVLHEYVLITIGKRARPGGSIAPCNWQDEQRQNAS